MNTQIQTVSHPGTGGALGPMVAAPPSPAGMHDRYEPYQKLHRLLRGRYRLVVILAGLCGLGGAVAGYFALKPQYRGEGWLVLASERPRVLYKTEDSAPMNMYEEYVQSQAMMMESRTILDKALKQPQWQQVGGQDTNSALADFAKNLSVEHPAHTEIIKVYFLDPNPVVAAAAVQAVVLTYESNYNLDKTSIDVIRKAQLDDKSRQLNERMGYDQSQIDAITSEFSTANLQPLYDIRLENVEKLEARYSDVQAALAMLEKQVTPGQAAGQLTNNQIAMVDSGMKEKMDLVANSNLRYQSDRLRLGENNFQVTQDLEMLKTVQKEADDYAKDFRDLQQKMLMTPGSHGGMPGAVQSVDSLKQQKDELEKLLGAARQDLNSLGSKQLALDKYQAELASTKASLSEIDNRTQELEMEGHGPGQDRLHVYSYGDIPVKPYKDRRLVLASIGGLLGTALPVALLLLVGLIDRRYRYSDDAEHNTDHPPLLGILPNLPARLEDPQVAAIAAHCIHQVRIMLQVGAKPGKSRAFMITSGGTGDGKTSLTMALGLSFAASGSRTLMIDADIIGQALSHRMSMGKDPGLLQALVDGSVRGRIKETATRNFWILPAGTTEARYANVLSSALADRVLNDARELFNTIIVDTGPILGSLEASVLAAHVDGVVLAVSRGEQQPMVQRALNQLHALGAHVSGLVFNRAERRDFHRSVASASIRSQAAAEQAPPSLAAESDESSKFGPLARSVASFIPDSGGSANGNGNGNGKHPATLPPRAVAAKESSVS